MNSRRPARNRARWIVVTILVALSALMLLAVAVMTIEPSPHHLEDRVSSDLQLLTSVLEQYYEENGRYPTASEGLGILKSRGYVQSSRFDIDPWGSELVYKSEDGMTRLYSLGQNRVDEGGGGDDIAVEL